MKPNRFLSYEWDAIAGILAATAAIVLHQLHIADEHIILPIVLALMALLFISFMRHTLSNERTAGQVERTQNMVAQIKLSLADPDVVLIGPRQLRTANEQFARNMRGEAILLSIGWLKPPALAGDFDLNVLTHARLGGCGFDDFNRQHPGCANPPALAGGSLVNVCLSMYRTQPLFDVLLRPAIENPQVTSIQFVLDESQQGLWQAEILPKITVCDGHSKVQEPHWCALSKNISFILADTPPDGAAEALVSFWGEPFMAQSTERNVPRYIFHIQAHSELLPHLVEMERNCRMHA